MDTVGYQLLGHNHIGILKMTILCMLLTCGFSFDNISKVKRDVLDGEHSESANCTLNPCDNGYCLNSGTCKFDNTTCQVECYCTLEFTGERCEKADDTSTTVVAPTISSNNLPTTTLRPDAVRTCIPGFVCVHGYCEKSNGFRCECDFGWKGVFCDQLDCQLQCPTEFPCIIVNSTFYCLNNISELVSTSSTEAPTSESDMVTSPSTIPAHGTSTTTLRPIADRECSHGFECVHGFCNTTHGHLCECDIGWIGTTCDQFDCPIQCPTDTVCTLVNNEYYCLNNYSDTSTKTTLSTSTTVSNDITNACSSNYTLRSLEQRQCVNNFICIYGRCLISELEIGISLECECDSGSIGALCDEICCRDCKNGRCNKFQNGTEYCECPIGYNGQFCENLVTRPTTASLTSAAENTTTSPDNTSFVGYPDNHTCSTNYVMKPEEDRRCFGFLMCVYGVCNITYSSNGDLTMACICDGGSMGALCQEQCCMPCSHGKCFKSSNGTEHCACAYGYTGRYCEEIMTKSSTTSSISTPDKSTMSTDNTSFTDFPDDHACSKNYVMRPEKERRCTGIFECIYGVCNGTEFSNGDRTMECLCDDGGLGGLCDDLCCMPCSHGVCMKYLNGTEFCDCIYSHTGLFCDRLKEVSDNGREELVLWPVWVTAGLLAFLILASSALFFWMWRNRVTVVMKIVHYFQAYEDDDDKTWDAFISYKSAEIDQKFVLHTLYPKLEKELGFKLCLHFRDFMPGETIANNIINAINNSRRTILILTPRYVQSEFTRFEYQVAQHEMLKRKHRIIPILLEDISEAKSTMDPNLKQIIKSVTYLEYPESDASEKRINIFWNKLVLSLPKKRSTKEKQKQGNENSDKRQSQDVGVISTNTLLNSNKLSTVSSPQGKEIQSIDSHDVVVNILDDKTTEKKEKDSPNIQQNVDKLMSLIET